MKTIYDADGRSKEYTIDNKTYSNGKCTEYMIDNKIYDAETNRIKEYIVDGKVYDAETNQCKEYFVDNKVYGVDGKMKEYTIDYGTPEPMSQPSFDFFSTQNCEDSEVDDNSDELKINVGRIFNNGEIFLLFLIVEIIILIISLSAFIPLSFVSFFLFKYLDKKRTDFWNGK